MDYLADESNDAIGEHDEPSTFIESRFARKAPFPWFGGKSKAAPLVWALLGDVDHYVEPFAGSLAVLLNRPHPCNRPYHSETVNDLDGFVVNAWRALAQFPDAVAEAASWPVSEACKTARQIALLKWRDDVALERLAGDATWCDPLMAGWWLWAVAVQIGAFTGDGPWTADPATGRIVKMRPAERRAGVARDRPFISNNGQGVNNPALREPGVARDLPHLSDDGRGVNTAREFGVGPDAEDFHPTTMPRLRAWFALLQARLRHVRILNGDWSRAVTTGASHTLSVRMGGAVGIFLDPPYAGEIRAKGLYMADDGSVATAVRQWCLKAGANPKNRIVLASFDVEHAELEQHGWRVYEWFTRDSYIAGGMGSQQHRERLWASPHCLVPDRQPDQPSLF
jgi:site-specific DNA-adenine methylase